MKRIKSQYKGLSIWLGGMKIDVSNDMTQSQIEILEKLKPEAVEQIKTKPIEDNTTGADSEPSEDGDTTTDPRPSKGKGKGKRSN